MGVAPKVIFDPHPVFTDLPPPAKKNATSCHSLLCKLGNWNLLNLLPFFGSPTTVIIMGKITVAVIGAGVIGLTSAYSIKLFDENIDVTVFAEKFSPNTTSDGAAGVFLMFEAGMRDTPKHLLR